MQKLELSTELAAAAAGFDKRPEELVGVRLACNHVVALVRSIVDQSVRALDAIVKQVGVLLVVCFHTGLEDAYVNNQLLFAHSLTPVSGVEANIIELQSPAPSVREGADSVGRGPPAIVPSKASTPPGKE